MTERRRPMLRAPGKQPEDELVDQLTEVYELAAREACLTFGSDLARVLQPRVPMITQRVVSEILGADPGASRAAAEEVLQLEHRGEDPPADWWRTPLGRVCARRLATQYLGRSVTYQVAADMLGLQRGTVSTMVARGTLERAPDGGGVSLASVLARIGRGAAVAGDSDEAAL